MPSDLEACFKATVKAPGKRGAPLSAEENTALIIALVGSNRAKSRCGMRALAYLKNLGAPA